VKRHLAVAVGPSLFADALASVLAEDEVDEVIDLTQVNGTGPDGPGAGPGAATPRSGRRFDIAVVSPGRDEPDADVVIVLPPSGEGEVAVVGEDSRTRRVSVVVHTVDELFDLLDAYCPAGRPRRRPFA
jgi:hypothetical protein